MKLVAVFRNQKYTITMSNIFYLIGKKLIVTKISLRQCSLLLYGIYSLSPSCPCIQYSRTYEHTLTPPNPLPPTLYYLHS